MKKKLTILAGLSGSGKSTLAGALHSVGALIISTDSFLIDETGRYNWTPQRLSSAIEESNGAFHSALAAGHSWIVLDNTNLRSSLIKESWDAAELVGYTPELCLFQRSDDLDLYSRNIHSVPAQTLQRQAQQWDSLRSVLREPDIELMNPLQGGAGLLFWYADPWKK